MSIEDEVRRHLSTVEPGRWTVGVSGGLDSVALLIGLCRYRSDVEPIIAHLDHQARGDESDGDREFVVDLGRMLGVKSVVGKLDDFASVKQDNLEARYRLARHRLFLEVGTSHAAKGVLLAQHADDRAETVLLRLLRGGEPWALDGLHRDRRIDELRVVRPFLAMRRASLERFLRTAGQAWREDSSNQTADFARNRIRKLLRAEDTTTEPVLRLADAAGALRDWIETHAPLLPAALRLHDLADLPDPLARRSLRRWLRERGVAVADVSPDQIETLIGMARDRASVRAVTLAGGAVARRRGNQIVVD